MPVFEVGHLELRRQFLLVADGDGDEFFQRLRRDDDARRMDGRVARAAFESARNLDDLLRLRVLFHRQLQLGNHLQRLRDRDVPATDGRRDELGDLLDIGVGHVERAAHVLDGGLRGHRPERDDLADRVAPVELRDVVDDLAAPVDAEVNINIRHRDAVGVQETLEEEVILDGVNVGNLKAVGDQAPGSRAAARPDGNLAVFGELDEVQTMRK